MVDNTTKEHLALYSVNCLNCRHLNPSAAKKFTKCHYSKGNQFCPAEEVQIVIVGQAYRYAQSVIKARERRDAAAEARIMSAVAKKPQVFQERFYSAIENPSEINL